MLAGTVGEGLFASAGADLESRELLRHGVLPHSLKRSIFIGTLEGVVFPGWRSSAFPAPCPPMAEQLSSPEPAGLTSEE